MGRQRGTAAKTCGHERSHGQTLPDDGNRLPGVRSRRKQYARVFTVRRGAVRRDLAESSMNESGIKRGCF
jgi:hypothetical protein